jgi:hypothetical protein
MEGGMTREMTRREEIKGEICDKDSVERSAEELRTRDSRET